MVSRETPRPAARAVEAQIEDGQRVRVEVDVRRVLIAADRPDPGEPLDTLMGGQPLGELVLNDHTIPRGPTVITAAITRRVTSACHAQ